jgi:hypothetical protein
MCKSDVGIKYRILQVAHGEVLSVMEVKCVIYIVGCGLIYMENFSLCKIGDHDDHLP